MDIIPVEEVAKRLGMSLPKCILFLVGDVGKTKIPASSANMLKILDFMAQRIVNPNLDPEYVALSQQKLRGNKDKDGFYRLDVESYVKEKGIEDGQLIRIATALLSGIN